MMIFVLKNDEKNDDILFIKALIYNIKIDMNLYQILSLSVVVLVVSCGWTNTTQFWKDKLKTDMMHYQCYSGIYSFHQGY